MTPYARLCGWRLRHLAAATFRLLVRRWYALVFLLLVLSPTDMPVAEQLQLLGAPVLQLLQAGDAARAIGFWIALLLVAWSWSALQAQALAGGRAWDHLASLPLAPRLLQRVDLTVVAIADLPLWLPYLAALVALASAHRPAGEIACVPALGLQMLVVQCLALRKPRGIAACVAGSCAGFALAAATGQAWLLFIATMAGTTGALALTPQAGTRVPRGPGRPWLVLRPQWSPGLQIAAIDLRFLFGPGALGRHFGLMITVPLPPVLLAFLRNGGLQPSVITIALVLLLPSLLFRVSALALDLKRLHLPMERVHASLGVTPAWLFRIALAVLALLFTLATLPLTVTLWQATGAATAWATLPIGIAALAAMIWIDRAGARRRFVARVLVAALACLAVYALL